MRISALESYGLRCLLALASKETKGTMTIPDIAKIEGLSIPYASKLLSILRKHGLVHSVRGRGGGFRISRPPAQINLLEVLTALDGPLIEPEHCRRFSGQLEECIHTEKCSIHNVLGDLAEYLSDFLGKMTLKDILENDSRENLKPIEQLSELIHIESDNGDSFNKDDKQENQEIHSKNQN